MFDYRPDPTLQQAQREKMAGGLRSALSGLAAPSGVSAEIERMLSEGVLAGTGVLHPDLFDLHNVVEGLVQRDAAPDGETWIGAFAHATERIRESRARALENERMLGARFDLSPQFPRAAGIMRRAVLMRWPDRLDEAGLVGLSPFACERVKEAFAILEGTWPELLGELEEEVSNLLFFAFQGLLGFSGLEYHGGIFLKVQDVEDPVKLAENILHEGSHVRLNTAMASVRYFQADEQGRYASPLREDPRPVFGVFHQMFVLGRMLHFYDRARERLGIVHKQHDVVRRQFSEALVAVESNVKLTSAGRALKTSLEEIQLEVAA